MSGVLALIAAALIVAADQVSKYLVSVNFTTDMAPVPLLGGLFNLHYTTNGGAAWNILEGKTWLLLAISITVIIVCIYMLVKKTYGSKLMFWAISIILAGGLGNLIDRVFRGGRVIDFIEVGFFEFPIFNIADIAVCCGAAMVILYFIIDTVKESKAAKNGKSKTENPSADAAAAQAIGQSAAQTAGQAAIQSAAQTAGQAVAKASGQSSVQAAEQIGDKDPDNADGSNK